MSAKTIYDELHDAITEAKSLTDAAVTENRDLTDGERTRFLDLQAKAEAMGKRITAQRESLAFGEKFAGLVPPSGQKGVPTLSGAPFLGSGEVKKWSRRVVESPSFATYKAARGTISLDLDLEAKALIGYPDVPAATDVALPAATIAPMAPRRPTVAGLMAQGTTDAGAVPYVEIVGTQPASMAQTAKGAAKVEPVVAITQKIVPVETIAGWIQVPDQLLEDVPAVESVLENLLINMLFIDEDRQLIKGTGTAGELQGVTTLTGLAPTVTGDSATVAAAILEQYMAIYASSGFMPTGIAIHPAALPALLLTQSAMGTFITPGVPFDRSPLPFRIWGLETIATPALTAGTAVVGAFATNSQLFRKRGVRVTLTNSHADFFIKNITVIRVEIREAAVWYTPAAFGIVDGLGTAPALGTRSGPAGGRNEPASRNEPAGRDDRDRR